MRVQSWVRKIRWRRKWQLTPVFLPRKSHGQSLLLVIFQILLYYRACRCSIRQDIETTGINHSWTSKTRTFGPHFQVLSPSGWLSGLKLKLLFWFRCIHSAASLRHSLQTSYLSRPSMTLCPQGLLYSYVLPGLEASLSPASPHIGGVWAPHLPPALTDLIHVVLGQKQSGSRCLWGRKKKLQKSKLCHSSNKVQEILDKQQFR